MIYLKANEIVLDRNKHKDFKNYFSVFFFKNSIN